MKRQLSNTMDGLKFVMEKNEFERLKSSDRKKRNDFVANPIHTEKLFIVKFSFIILYLYCIYFY